MNTRGFNLIETVLYIGLLAVLVPSFVTITLGFIQKSDAVDPVIRMEQKAALVFSEMANELARAQSVNVTASTLGVEDSSFVFVDEDGESVTLHREADTVSFVGGDQQVERLVWETAVASQWVTDADMEVETWNVSIVRDGDGVLTGVNVLLTLQVLNADGSPLRELALTTQTTIYIRPYTTEL
ncbi:MAG: hypothetical protein NUV84_04205 [Candidatus Uhrbacteria bacterium]|nr:hypothetical protein [Candidatus Uhrbacteria bacterium]